MRQRRLSAAEVLRVKRMAAERHVQDPGNPRQALCGKFPPFPVLAFGDSPGTTCGRCEPLVEETLEFLARKADAHGKKAKQPRGHTDYSEAERRKLRIRPAQEEGLIECFTIHRMESSSPCGGGWRA